MPRRRLAACSGYSLLMPQAPRTSNVNSEKTRPLRKTDVSGVRWFLAATVATSVFVTLVQHNFWRDSFNLAAIVRIELISILLGWLFSVTMLAALISNINKRTTSHEKDAKPERHSERRLNIEAPIVLDVMQMNWLEQLHFAVVSILGSRLRLFKAVCLTLIVVAPAIAYSMKSGWTIGSSNSPKSIAAVFILGFLAIAVLIGIAIVIRLIPVADKLRTRFYRLKEDTLESHVAGGLKEAISWNAVNRVYRTARFLGVEADGRLVLSMPRRAIDDGVINRIGEVVNIESD